MAKVELDSVVVFIANVVDITAVVDVTRDASKVVVVSTRHS